MIPLSDINFFYITQICFLIFFPCITFSVILNIVKNPLSQTCNFSYSHEPFYRKLESAFEFTVEKY